jgi:polyribonucleotide nucleotidyltransferase
MLLEKKRLAAVESAVRAQFENELRTLTDVEQDSKELKSRKRDILLARVQDELQLPFPAGDGDEPKDSVTRSYVKKAADAIYKDLVRKKIAVDKRRPDGRGTEEIRPITTEVGISPRTHGSALFTRGQTQILTLCTLGTAKEQQRIDDLSTESERRYMHHYNFPPYSVGETGFMRGPKRRDIGHGALAQRALEAVIPTPDEFPYTIRIVSETLESNGSSSMGSVCGSTLSLMDAGVPIKAPVSGIAMGLVKEGDDYVILTDIQGAEDHLGDMDFKVAGSRDGITALQMDIKITGVTQEIMRDALEQAKRAREFILEKMLDVIPESRAELSDNAPRITTIKIDQEKIGMVIGKGGETIRGLESDYEVQIDIEEDGTILIYATEGTKAKEAVAAIESLTKEPEVGDTFTGKVVKTTQFGAFVELKKGTDGLLHVSNVGPGRVAHIEDVMSRGDIVDVVVQEVDKARGRIGLKLVAKHENGGLVQPEELIERAKDAPPRPPEEDRPRGGDRRGGRGGRGRGPRRDDGE